MRKRVRLEGPIPERLVDITGPVVSEGRGSLGDLVLSLVLLAFVVYSIPNEVHVILEEEADGLDLALSILFLGLIFLLLPVSILLLKIGVAEAWRPWWSGTLSRRVVLLIGQALIPDLHRSSVRPSMSG